MDMHSTVIGAISTVNPQQVATFNLSNGYSTSPDGTQVPAYTSTPARVQVQALTDRDLKHLASLNIEPVTHKLYAFGRANGVVRKAAMGGDLFTIGDNVWKVVAVIEAWPDWTSVAITQQLDPVS